MPDYLLGEHVSRIGHKLAPGVALVLLFFGHASRAPAETPRWVEQVRILANAALKNCDLVDSAPLTAEEEQALDKYAAERWKAAEEGPANQYLELIEDRDLAVDWLRSPKLVEPANPILVDPLDAAWLDRDPVFYVNGPWRSRVEAIHEARQVALLMKQPVWLIYNPTISNPAAINREDYLRIVDYLLFFGLPVPENLVDATLDGGQLIDISGSQRRSLADVAEAQWDTYWYDWMSQAPEVKLAGRKWQVYPHQHNETTRQLAWVLLNSDRPLTVVTDSQGGLIFRNASLIASKLGNIDWSKRRVTWRSIALPLAEQPRTFPLPGMVQTQLLFDPSDPFAMALSGRGLFAKWGNPAGDGWGFGGAPGFNPAVIWPVFNFSFGSNPPPELPRQYGMRLQVINESLQRVRIYVQHVRATDSAWEPEPDGPRKDWRMKELASGETWDSGIVTPVIRYWVDYEYGWRDLRRSTNNPLWLVDINNPSYVSDTPVTYSLPVLRPKGAQSFSAVLVATTNSSAKDVKVQIDGTYDDAIFGPATPSVSKVTIAPSGTTNSIPTVGPIPAIAANSILRDSGNWPIRAATITANVMQANTNPLTVAYTFAPGTTVDGISSPNITKGPGATTFQILAPGTYGPIPSSTGRMLVQPIDFN